jgi:hypothetical protein
MYAVRCLSWGGIHVHFFFVLLFSFFYLLGYFDVYIFISLILICVSADMFACGDPHDYACDFVNGACRKLQITQSCLWRVPPGLMCSKESLVSE